MGGGGGGSVDDIWAQLKAKTAPSQHAHKAKQLLRGAHLTGDASAGRGTLPSRSTEKNGFELPVAPHAGREKDGSSSAATASTRVDNVRDGPAAASDAPVVSTFADYEALQAGVARDLNTLADAGSASSRLKALRRVSDIVNTVSVQLVGAPRTSDDGQVSRPTQNRPEPLRLSAGGRSPPRARPG